MMDDAQWKMEDGRFHRRWNQRTIEDLDSSKKQESTVYSVLSPGALRTDLIFCCLRSGHWPGSANFYLTDAPGLAMPFHARTGRAFA
jgi:hypothetical protein